MTTSNGTLPAQIINLAGSRAWLLSAGEHSADGTGYAGYCRARPNRQRPPLAQHPRTPRLPKLLRRTTHHRILPSSNSFAFWRARPHGRILPPNALTQNETVMTALRQGSKPRAAIYARYSTDLQSAASIQDQARLCHKVCADNGWEVVETFADEAMSGATHLRPGFQALQRAAMNGAFDIIVAQALDRLSRDQEHIAALHKRMGFHDVKIFTKAEGEINEMHIGLGGTMSALFLKNLAQKTHRGLEGRVRDGKSAGGISYG